MTGKVIDASALAAVLFGEPQSTEISERIGDTALVAPTLLPYEIASVGRKKIRRRPGDLEAVIQSLTVYPRLQIQEVEIAPAELTGLAAKEGLTAYDAAYLWLARSLKSELVTLDERLAAAASR